MSKITVPYQDHIQKIVHSDGCFCISIIGTSCYKEHLAGLRDNKGYKIAPKKWSYGITTSTDNTKAQYNDDKITKIQQKYDKKKARIARKNLIKTRNWTSTANSFNDTTFGKFTKKNVMVDNNRLPMTNFDEHVATAEQLNKSIEEREKNETLSHEMNKLDKTANLQRIVEEEISKISNSL